MNRPGVPGVDDEQTVAFRIPYPPTLNHNVRQGRGIRYRTAEYKGFLRDVELAWAVGRHDGWRSNQPVYVELAVIPPDRRRRDLDNVIKPILDALQYAGALRDDAQVVAIHAERLLASKPNCGVRVRMTRNRKWKSR